VRSNGSLARDLLQHLFLVLLGWSLLPNFWLRPNRGQFANNILVRLYRFLSAPQFSA
jgi:hypothetical protein